VTRFASRRREAVSSFAALIAWHELRVSGGVLMWVNAGAVLAEQFAYTPEVWTTPGGPVRVTREYEANARRV
jgi:hypothetical protein